MVVNDGFWVDAEAMVDRGQQLDRVNWVLEWRRSGFVALAMHIAPFDASTCDDGRCSSTASDRVRRQSSRFQKC